MSDLSPSSRRSPSDPLDEVAEAYRRAIASAGRGWVPLWAAAPTALLDHHRSPKARPAALIAASKTLLSGLAGDRGSSLATVDDVLFAYEGANPAATLQPVIEGLARAHGTSPVARAVRPRLSLLTTGRGDVRDAEIAVEHELTGGVPPALAAALQAAVRARARAVAALDAISPRLLVVASQHSTSSRALLHAAGERSIPTAYLPHAPVADTYQYRDLPTHYAGLRGWREVEFYRALGAERDASVVGNPQGSIQVPERLDPSGAVIFAPRPQPLEQLQAQVAAIAAVAPAVVVSPHPRMRGKPQYDGLWPAHWQVHDSWTVELLRQGHPCVIQMSSGVAWEAMAHGVPVIELAADSGAAPLYLVIREPYARVCAFGPELRNAVADARRRATDPTARDRLRAWAHEWCSATGVEAVAQAVIWIDEWSSATPPAGPLLDHWASGRAA